jgi:hypothetical protein
MHPEDEPVPSDDESDIGDDKYDSKSSRRQGDDLKLLEAIGKGAYGVVYRAVWHGQIIAAKIIEHDDAMIKHEIDDDGNFCPFERNGSVGGAGAIIVHAKHARFSSACTI